MVKEDFIIRMQDKTYARSFIFVTTVKMTTFKAFTQLYSEFVGTDKQEIVDRLRKELLSEWKFNSNLKRFMELSLLECIITPEETLSKFVTEFETGVKADVFTLAHRIEEAINKGEEDEAFNAYIDVIAYNFLERFKKLCENQGG
ncbi:MAG: hypothetical protein WC998_00745 [Candidatus Paceibacterota bacterium]|jgi:hypothetical protein